MNTNLEKDSLDLQVVLASPSDWQACRDLIMEMLSGPFAQRYRLAQKRLLESEQKTEQTWKDELSSDGMFAVLVKHDSLVVGIGYAKKRKGGVWQILDIYVKADYQKRGISKEMFALGIKQIFHRGGKKAMMIFPLKNQASIAAAEGCGFSRAGEYHGLQKMELDLLQS